MHQHSGIQHDNNAKKAYDNNDFQSAEIEWNVAKSDFKTAIELIKKEKFNISIELLEIKYKMFDLNLKQLEIEKACLETDKDVEKAKRMDETQVIEAIKIVLDSQEKYSRVIIEAGKTKEF